VGITFLDVPPNVEGWEEPKVIIRPSQAWEFDAGAKEGAVFEPSVIYDANSGVYTMWYSAGWETCATGTATSTDGVNWTKNPQNPLIGKGKMGFGWACRNSVLRVNGETYVYFNANFHTSTGVESVIYVTHSPDGVHDLSEPVPLIAAGEVDYLIANSWSVLLPDGKVRFFYDSITPTLTYEVFSALCDGPLGPCVKDAGPLKGMQIGHGAAGGGSARLVDGRFDTYYLAGSTGVETGHVPTYIYHSCDAFGSTLGNNGNPLFALPAGYDQHGDPFVMDGGSLPGGRSLLYFDRVDNPRAYGDILLASRPGALSSVCP
jgi:hypothetical protein